MDTSYISTPSLTSCHPIPLPRVHFDLSPHHPLSRIASFQQLHLNSNASLGGVGCIAHLPADYPMALKPSVQDCFPSSSRRLSQSCDADTSATRTDRLNVDLGSFPPMNLTASTVFSDDGSHSDTVLRETARAQSTSFTNPSKDGRVNWGRAAAAPLAESARLPERTCSRSSGSSVATVRNPPVASELPQLPFSSSQHNGAPSRNPSTLPPANMSILGPATVDRNGLPTPSFNSTVTIPHSHDVSDPSIDSLPLNSSMPTAQTQRAEFVGRLVGTAATIIENIWPHTHSAHPPSSPRLLPLRPFIESILRRSRTSFSTLQLSLFYLLRLCTTRCSSPSSPSSSPPPTTTLCGRRMFLASLVVASKYLQDKNFGNRAWAKICSLDVAEVNAAEREFLAAVGYRVHVEYATFVAWSALLLQRCSGGTGLPAPIVQKTPVVEVKREQQMDVVVPGLVLSPAEEKKQACLPEDARAPVWDSTSRVAPSAPRLHGKRRRCGEAATQIPQSVKRGKLEVKQEL